MKIKISIIIPNFNGRQLLKNNLPAVIDSCNAWQEGSWEIIIIDDCSTDDSFDFIKKNYPSLRLIRNSKNKGFAFSCNLGVKEARGEIVILLNTDVKPERNFVTSLVGYFKNDDVFSVSSLENTFVNQKKELHGRGRAVMRGGLFLHQRYEEYDKNGYSLWAVGGAAAFDRCKWLNLGGFDLIFSPFYWEDVDLCFRAWMRGWKTFFEPASVVLHDHLKGSINTTYPFRQVKEISSRNQFLFFWKHFLFSKYIIWHLIHLPVILLRDRLGRQGFLRALARVTRLKPEKYREDKFNQLVKINLIKIER